MYLHYSVNLTTHKYSGSNTQMIERSVDRSMVFPVSVAGSHPEGCRSVEHFCPLHPEPSLCLQSPRCVFGLSLHPYPRRPGTASRPPGWYLDPGSLKLINGVSNGSYLHKSDPCVSFGRARGVPPRKGRTTLRPRGRGGLERER